MDPVDDDDEDEHQSQHRDVERHPHVDQLGGSGCGQCGADLRKW